MDSYGKTAYEIADEAEMRGELDPDEHLHLLEETNPDRASSKARAEKVREIQAKLKKMKTEVGGVAGEMKKAPASE